MGHKRRCQKRVTAAVDPILKFSTGAFSFAFAMESIAIASPRMVAGGMVDGGMGWDGGWWMGPLSGYCRRQKAAAHGLNGQFKCKLANALAEKARSDAKSKNKSNNTTMTTTNKRNSFACCLLVASRGAAHAAPLGCTRSCRGVTDLSSGLTFDTLTRQQHMLRLKQSRLRCRRRRHRRGRQAAQRIRIAYEEGAPVQTLYLCQLGHQLGGQLFHICK